MIGINIENLDKIIRINNINYDSLNKDMKYLQNNLSELDNVYKGNSLEFVFSGLQNQYDNLNKILNVIHNYSDVLATAKISYEQQDLLFADMFKNTD